MGNQFSNTIPPEKFRDQVFSIVLFYVSQKANPHMKFVPRDKCTGDQLPSPPESDLTQLLNLYGIEDQCVSNYINQNILDSEENLIRFYQTLINLLRSKEKNQLLNPDDYDQGTRARKLTRSHLDRIPSKHQTIASLYEEKKQRSLRDGRRAPVPSEVSNLTSDFTQASVVRDTSKRNKDSRRRSRTEERLLSHKEASQVGRSRRALERTFPGFEKDNREEEEEEEEISSDFVVDPPEEEDTLRRSQRDNQRISNRMFDEDDL